jgi:hypothetical protein
MIRLAKRGDLPAILSIFSYARKFMSQQGNPTQWGTTYPSRKLVIEDIEHETCYVFEKMGQIVGVFTLIIGEDETYQFIEKGDWHLNQPYGTIHRLASNGQWPSNVLSFAAEKSLICELILIRIIDLCRRLFENLDFKSVV